MSDAQETAEVEREGSSEGALSKTSSKAEVKPELEEKDPVLKLLSEREAEIERLRKSRAKLVEKLRGRLREKKAEAKASSEREPETLEKQDSDILNFLFE
jgi:hypothetical protein